VLSSRPVSKSTPPLELFLWRTSAENQFKKLMVAFEYYLERVSCSVAL